MSAHLQDAQQDALTGMEEQQAGLDRARAGYADKMSRLERVEAQQQAESQRLAQREEQLHRQVHTLCMLSSWSRPLVSPPES